MKDIYYLSEQMFYGNTAGTKARNDLEVIFSKRYKHLGGKIKSRDKKNIFYLASSYLKVRSFTKLLLKTKDKVIIFQYPVTKRKYLSDIINKIASNNKLIFFVHDINYLRNDEVGKEEEIKFLNLGYGVICHNERMKQKLISDGLTVKHLYVLDCFDYLLDYKAPSSPLSKTVVYAGNLDKGSFLSKIDEVELDFTFNLFGPNYQGGVNKSAVYKGSFPPNEIPKHLKSSFGLVWDGVSLDTCTGQQGYYNRFNNPHKLSLYLSSCVPVIVWKESAIADFVKKNNVGLLIDSIFDINKKLSSITEKEYEEIINNVKKIQDRLISGFYTNRVLDEIENDLDK